jgi:hypothetical protein
MTERPFIYNMNTKYPDIRWDAPWVIGKRHKGAEAVQGRFETLPEAMSAAIKLVPKEVP